MEEQKQQLCLNKGSIVQLSQNSDNYKIGLQWEKFQKEDSVDLDLQCVLMNEISEVTDVVYYNKLVSDCGAVIHSGDIKEGEKEGVDEQIAINMNKLKYDIKYIAILVCSYEGQTFSKVESACIELLENDKLKTSISIGALGNSTSCLVCLFGKDYQNKWTFYNSSQTSNGKNYMECEQLIKTNLKFVGFDEVLLMESKNWSQGKSFNLIKDQVLFIPKDCSDKIQVGLGWDTRCDIDSSVLMMNQQGQLYDNVYFGNKTSKDKSVKHSGDNLTGVGSGDDETISINLNIVDPNVYTLWAVITVYSHNKQFDDVNGAYCRLLLNKKEFCKYNLSKNKDGVSNGNIMCMIKKYGNNQWAIKSLGYYTKNTSLSKDVINIVQEVLQNNCKNIKILESSCDKKNHEVQKLIQKQPILKQNTSYFIVTIKSATQLGSFDSNGKSDPYCKLKINGKKVFKTQTIKKTLDPVWNEQCKIMLSTNDNIQFNLYDYDFMARDDYMGSCFLKITPEIYNKQKSEFTLQVLDREMKESNKYIGKLQIELAKLA